MLNFRHFRISGIARWINTYFKLKDEKQISKNSILVAKVKEWVDEEYNNGRVTVMTDDEIIRIIDQLTKDIGPFLLD